MFLPDAYAEDEPTASFGPMTYGLLTLRSGHTFKFIIAAPVTGEGGKRLGLGLVYVSDTRDPEGLEEAADELFDYSRASAVAQGEERVLVMAYLSFNPSQLSKKTQTYNIVYERDSAGRWKRLPRDSQPPVPKGFMEVESLGYPDLRRDPEAEKEALADATAWLSLVDMGAYKTSWDEASPFLKGVASQARWKAIASANRRNLGRLLSRTRISMMSTNTLPDAPDGRYITFEYESKFLNREIAFESITEMLCKDGRWRVAGYSLR